MVFDSILEKVLSKFLGNIFYGIIKQNIKTDLIKGKFTIQNIGLHNNLFENMNLPFDICYSYVQKIQLQIPWRTQQPSTLNISTIYAILVYKDIWDLKTVHKKKKEGQIKKYLNEKSKSKPEKKEMQDEKKSGALADKLGKLTDNIKINISSIHLRFEHNSEKIRYSFGVKVQDILCATVNEKGFAEFFNREKARQNFVRYVLNIDPLAIYVNPNQKYFLSELTQYAQITNAMAQMDRNSSMRSYGKQIVSIGMQSLKFIMSLSIKAQLRKYFNIQKTSNAQKFECDVNFHEIQLSAGHEQFHAILDLVNRLIQYQITCDWYESKVEINMDKEREAKDILNLMKRKKINSEKEAAVLKKMIRNYFGWNFRMGYIELLQKKFLRQALRKEITLQNLFQNAELERIMSKINIKLLKKWVDMAIILREKYKKSTSVFTSSKDKQIKLMQFCNSQIESFIRQGTISKAEQIEQISHQRLSFKLSMNVHMMSFQLAKEQTFGMNLKITNLGVFLWKREQKNYVIEFLMQDLLLNAFDSAPGQKNPAYVPFLYRNKYIQTNDKYLLQLKFEKSPLGNPFVFSTTDFKFNSIQVTIYPQIYQKLYETFIAEQTITRRNDHHRKNENPIKSKKQIKQEIKSDSSAQQIQQYNIIQGVIHSPWIVIPLSHTNDFNKQCWVLRLGDLYIDTEDTLLKRDQYESLSLELKHFELKYFSSIKYFHSWLHNGMDMEILSRLPNCQNNKIIDVIEPISCYADLKVLKRHVSEQKKKKKQFLISNIKIDKVFIRLPKLIVDKLKQRVDLFEEERQTQLIQTDPKNILQEYTISGLATVTSSKIKNMLLFVVLKNNHLYFFFKDNRNKILMTQDVRENVIRLTTDHHSYVNEKKGKKKLNIELRDARSHQQWHRCLQQIVMKRDRRPDLSFLETLSKNTHKDISEHEANQKNMSSQNKGVSHQPQASHSNSNSIKIMFTMANLSIQLINADNSQFLFCMFEKTEVCYQNLWEKKLDFSICNWNVLEKSTKKFDVSDPKHNIPFLASRRFFGEKKPTDSQKIQNFLKATASFSSITGDLQKMDIQVDQLYISWDIFIFNKMLAFFFYRSVADDLPSVSNPDKKKLLIVFHMKRFYLYCFHDQSELIALFKFHAIEIQYNQSNIEEHYKVRCQKFQAQKFIDNNASQRMPMIVCRKNRNVSMLRESVLEQIEEDYIQNRPQTDREQSEGFNRLDLQYHIRKKETEKFENVRRLKKKFGDDVMISQMKCTWQDTIIYFQQEQTFRLLNFFLNQILTTVTSKFKKREYSENYIEKALQIKKISTFDANLNNIVVLVPPHERNSHFLEILIDQIKFSKNIKPHIPQYEPSLVTIPTKTQKGRAEVFYDTIVFEVMGVLPFYKYGSEPSISIVDGPFNIEVSYSKLNFPREYQPILKSIDTIDKTIHTKIKVFPNVTIELQKIFFVTFLQIFYQNIKHRDGKAHMFETPQVNPPKKVYEIKIQDVNLNMYEYREMQPVSLKVLRASSRRMSTVDSKDRIKKFQKFRASSLVINYENIGQKSDIKLLFSNMMGSGEIPMKSLNPTKKSNLILEMASNQGEMNLNVRPNNYELQINLDKLTQVLQFINYDSDYVSNKVMPKKKGQSWQNINIFPEACAIKLRDLRVQGNFCISYMKEFKNPIPPKICEYLIQDLAGQQRKSFYENIQREVSDKQIKVSGQDLIVYMKGQHIGDVKNLFFSRLQLVCKSSNRRFKKEMVHIGGLKAFANLLTLKNLFSVYENNVKKSSYFKEKIYFEPYHAMPAKKKLLEKRITTVEFDNSSVYLIKIPESSQQKIYFQPYFTIDFMIPKIVYATYQNQQQISICDLQAKILQTNLYILPKTLVHVKDFSLDYLTDKNINEKKINIHNAKNLKIYLRNLNERLCAYFGKQIKKFNLVSDELIEMGIQEEGVNRKYRIVFTNLTNKKMEIIVRLSPQKNGHESIHLGPNQVKQYKKSAVQIFSFLNTNSEIGFQQEQHSPNIIKKFSEIRVNEPTQLFSSSAIKYDIIPDGISFSICENNCIWNVSTHTCFIYLFNKNKECMNREGYSLQPKGCKFFARDNNVTFILIQPKFANKQNNPNLSSISESALVKLVDIPIEDSIQIKPSRILSLKREQSGSGRDFMKLVIFNKFKLKNYLPLGVQVNFSKIRPFSTSTINLDQSNSNELIFTIEQINNIILDLGQLEARTQEVKNKKIKVSKNVGNVQLIYSIRLEISRCHIKDNEESHTLLEKKPSFSYSRVSVQAQEKNSLTDPASDYFNLLSTSNFPYYQVLLKMSTSTIVKNRSCSELHFRFFVNNQILSNERNKKIESEGYLMLPENIEGVIFYKDEIFYRNLGNIDIEKLQTRQMKEIMIFRNSDLKFSEGAPNIFWGSFLFERIKVNNSESIFIINDICLVENKTQMALKIFQEIDSSRLRQKPEPQWVRSDTKSRIQLLSRQRDRRERMQEKAEQNLMSQFVLNVEAHCQNLVSQTLLPLSIPQPQNNIIYWAVGVCSSREKKMVDKDWVESATYIIKITILKLSNERYHVIFQDSEEEGLHENLLDSKALFSSIKSEKKPKKKYVQQEFGYRFYNQMPKGYILTIREQNGILPCNRNSNNFDEVMQRESSIRDSNQGRVSILSPRSMDNPKTKNAAYRKLQEKSAQQKNKKLQIAFEKPVTKIHSVQYSIRQNQKICLGLTNLQLFDSHSRAFTLEFYQEDHNLEYSQTYSINLNKLPTRPQKIHLSSSQSKFSHNLTPNLDLSIGIFIHKKKQSKYDIYVRPTKQVSEKDIEKLYLNVSQIACTIELSHNPKDSLTLQLENFLLNRLKYQPSSNIQKVNVKLQKILLREDRTLSIIQMIDMKRPFFKGEVNLEKTGFGEYMNLLKVDQAPLQIRVREGILFKVLCRIVEIREHYFDKTNISFDDVKRKLILDPKQHRSLDEHNQKLLKEFNKIQKSTKLVFIQRLHLQPTNLYLSYKKDEYSKYEEFVNDPIIKYFILIPGINELKVCLPEFQRENYQGTAKQLTKGFVKEIKKNIGSTIFSSLSSISLFDSPVAAIDGFFQYTRAIFMIRNS